MYETQYKSFSLKVHKRNWRLNRPNACQFELTFGCHLHCKHCYTDCYNNKRGRQKELDTKKVKLLLDKLSASGVLWLFLTGGDPLFRKDFLEIYSYAKDKGFLITVFTNGFSMTSEIIRHFMKMPPFVIEITLNAVTEKLFEEMSQVKGSFVKTMNGLRLITDAGLPLKIKTDVTRDNLREIDKTRRFVEALGIKFTPNIDIHARLNGDPTPCSLRIMPSEALKIKGKEILGGSCRPKMPFGGSKNQLFRCAAGGGDGIYMDPFGNITPCNLIRKPSFSLLDTEINDVLRNLSLMTSSRAFVTESKCRDCGRRNICRLCPGKAYLEKGDMEAPVEYYCKMAEFLARGENGVRAAI
jgi:radical SAM protein with 4Fe4S-binding SPASM domain